MSHREQWKWVYKVVRSVLFTTIIFVGVLYVSLYVLLSVPSVQNKVREVAEQELSALFGSRLTIDEVSIYPFNEVVVEGVDLFEPSPSGDAGGSGPLVAHIDRVGAGISMFNLLFHRRIIITYVELLGLDARLRQDAQGGPLNIRFLIDAFAPKDKNKPPARFDLQIRNIVIRKSKASFSRPWLADAKASFPNLPMLSVEGLNADVALPRLSNDDIEVDLRRLEFTLKDYIKVERLMGLAVLKGGRLSLTGVALETPESRMKIGDMTIPVKADGGIKRWLERGDILVELEAERLTPSEFSAFWAPLSEFPGDVSLSLRAKGGKKSIVVERLFIETLHPASYGADGYFSLSMENASAEIGQSDRERRIPLPFDNATLGDFYLISTPAFNSGIARMFKAQGKLPSVISVLGDLDVSLAASLSPLSGDGEADLDFRSGAGDLLLDATWQSTGNADILSLHTESEGIDLGSLLATDALGNVAVSLKADARISKSLFGGLKGVSPERLPDLISEAEIALDLPEAVIKGYRLQGTQINVSKNGKDLKADVNCDDENFTLSAGLQAVINGAASTLSLDGDVRSFRPSVLHAFGSGADFDASGDFDARLTGCNLNNLQGEIGLSGIHFHDFTTGRQLEMDSFRLYSYISTQEMGGGRSYDIISDWVEGGVSGHFLPGRLPGIVHTMLSRTLPSLIPAPKVAEVMAPDDNLAFDFKILRDGNWNELFHLPVKLLYEARVKGEIDGAAQMMSVDVTAPYIQHGRDKLIQNTHFSAMLQDCIGHTSFGTIYPTKKGDLHVESDIRVKDENFLVNLDFNPGRTTGFYGALQLEASVGESLKPLGRSLTLHILPGKLYLNGAAWNVSDALITYLPTTDGPKATVNGFGISHERQYVSIGGVASASPDDRVDVILNEIDLNYIFDTLNINYVNFGGLATGAAVGKALLSKSPEAETTRLFVKDLSYNHSVLGDAELHGDFDMQRKRVGIRADIEEEKRPTAIVDGGIWLGRDSLSFAIDADKVRIGFMQPFMAAFSSNVEGRASGNALLYGTFSDIDMKGRLFADTISLKVDYTNVTYCGSDSVIIDPGRITIPAFTLHDQYGHSATLRGELTHRYFHEPEFDFRVTDARNLLIYDTNARMNPVWYGRIFGSGGGRILGRGNYVGITADMTTEANSVFTFVLSDREEAAEYRFLTFTDKRREAAEAEAVVEFSEPDEIVKAFRKKVQEQMGPESVFGMDIRATLTPAAKLILVMDPIAGDKITARGSGAMNLTYQSDTDEMKMFGKYVLDEGVYNFSLQDVILKDFIIKRGSSISFNGDPLAGLLDIRAAYRVNTSLTDLDASFATDRDLNRTNVPVDAMLIVTGDMEQPDISFDIELPTLNDEVEQKVRSIISSDDMMNLQMIYLLALNRFYTPEYMGGTAGGEWASVASSTISSQLSNILGQLTDKVTVAPSFRSDKGDFSDLEVDLALSSRLLNNRLLINGNLGYRDPSTSSTTFVGDFDIEYLLNRAGNWRLRAYNHFNDQNYYLKSALTTQGVGIMWRRDFDHIFGINKHKKDRKPGADSMPRESSALEPDFLKVKPDSISKNR